MELQKIPLSMIHPSEMNPRKTFDEEGIRELAENIEKQGLLQPITIRPWRYAEGSGEVTAYELVCGERRWRAMCYLSDKWSGLDPVAPEGETFDRYGEILAIVREMTDHEAFDAMITENLQRKDVDPIEEGFAFGELHKRGDTAEEIAARFGKSIRYIQDRIKLNSLIPELKEEVKTGNCPVTAAYIICKLPEEDQRLYHSQYRNNYNGFTKDTAVRFTEQQFMSLERSLWYRDSPGYDGGCGRSCAGCEMNTSNHGCLFYEMKEKGAGNCTDRHSYQSKTLAYMYDRIDAMSGNLVKKGEPLEYGRTVVSLEIGSYDHEDVRELKKKVLEALESRNIEVVDPDRVFDHKCWYKADDESTIDMYQKGDIYRVLSLFNYSTPALDEEFWYVRKNADGEVREGVPVEVNKLLSSYKSKKVSLDSSLTVECVKAMSNWNSSHPISDAPLSSSEKMLLMAMILQGNCNLRKQLELAQIGTVDGDYAAVGNNSGKLDMFLRSWMQNSLHAGDNAMMRIAEPLLDTIGDEWCKDDYGKAKQKTLDKFAKFEAKTEERLRALGYDLEGNPLPKVETIELPDAGRAYPEQYNELKPKHPDSLLLFRIGDFYECFEDDAVTVSNILGITLTRRSSGKDQTALAGFPHHALDNYLPRLVSAGKRVAICEQLQDPRKKK